MNMAKRLYAGVGAILGLVALFLAFGIYRVNAQQRHATDVSDMLIAMNGLDNARMLNRLCLLGFLLNGDTTVADAVPRHSREIDDLITVAKQKAMGLGSVSREAQELLEDMRSNESSWMKEFANPLMDARRLVDSNKSTVAEMQITYLQMDPARWESKEEEPVKALNRIVDKAKASSQPAGENLQTGLLEEIIAGFILIVAFAMVITARLANGLPTSEKASLAISPR